MKSGDCPECGGKLVIDSKKEMVCDSCGLVTGFHEVRGGKSHNLGSVIDGVGPEDWENVTAITPRHKKLHEQVTNPSKSIEIDVEEEIDGLTKRLAMPDYMRKDARTIYFKFINKHSCKGIPNDELVAACIYAAYRVAGYPVMVEDISHQSGIEKEDVLKKYNLIRKELKLVPKLVTAEAYLPAMVKRLKLDYEVLAKAKEIVKKVPETGKPQIFAASAIYVATTELLNDGKNNCRRRQVKVASIAETTDVSIRNVSRYIHKKLYDEKS